MLDLSKEYGICRQDDGLDDLDTSHGEDCDSRISEDEDGNALGEVLCDRDDKPCVVGRIKFSWVGDPLPSED